MNSYFFNRKDRFRLVKTLFSRKPHSNSFIVSASMVFLCALISNLVWKNKNLADLLSASQHGVYCQQKWWQLMTTVFVHGDGLHLISNSFMLFILGFFVFGYYGWKVYPIYALAGATVTNALALLTYSPQVRLIGASGLVYYLAGFWLCLYVIIERQRTMGARVLRVLGVGLMVLFPSTFEMQVSYRTHAIGIVVGIFMAGIYYLKNRKRLHGFEVYKEVEEPEPEEKPITWH